MVWRKKHRAGRRRHERIAALKQKQPIITTVETGITSSRTQLDVNYGEPRGELKMPTVRATIALK